MTSEQGERILSILRSRDGRLTVATMNDGRVYRIINIAWGRDDSADFDHVSTNISPSVAGFTFDFFHTSEVRLLTDEHGRSLFSAISAGGI